jgi:UPF0716 protein FxsA
MPLRPLFDAACTLAAAVLLLVPGFLTDLLALALLLPWVRSALARRIGRAAFLRAAAGRGPGIVDGTFRVVEEEPGRQGRLPP